jgi:hypothetical protein
VHLVIISSVNIIDAGIHILTDKHTPYILFGVKHTRSCTSGIHRTMCWNFATIMGSLERD